MKITAKALRKIIREELSRLSEQVWDANAHKNVSLKVTDPRDDEYKLERPEGTYHYGWHAPGQQRGAVYRYKVGSGADAQHVKPVSLQVYSLENMLDAEDGDTVQAKGSVGWIDGNTNKFVHDQDLTFIVTSSPNSEG